MAFWGAPEIQSDSACRACRAALAISKSVQADNAKREKRGDPPIGLRIGLHVGPVVVGNIGSPERVNYTIAGDTVNVRQRLEALGKDIASKIPVIIVASGAVRESAEAEFDFRLVGDLPVKGGRERSACISCKQTSARSRNHRVSPGSTRSLDLLDRLRPRCRRPVAGQAI